MARVVAFVVVLLGTVFGGLTQFGTIEAAHAGTAGSVAVHIYDCASDSDAARDVPVERGPPLEHLITSVAGARGSLGASALASESTARGLLHDGDYARLVQVDIAASATAAPGQPIGGRRSSLPRAGVAADSGAGILANQAAGNAARDALAAAHPGR